MSGTSGNASTVPKLVIGRAGLYVMEAVESAWISSRKKHTSHKEARRTRDKRRGDDIEHRRVHVRMDGKVGIGVRARGDKDRVALGDRDREREDRKLFNVGPVNLGVIGSKHNRGKK